MADTWTPDPQPDVSTASEEKTRALVAKFGDGYEQRAADGLNPEELTVTLEWPVLSHTAIAALVVFLRAHPRHVRFDYQLPWEASPRRFVQEGWSRRETGAQRSSLTVKLREVHDL